MKEVYLVLTFFILNFFSIVNCVYDYPPFGANVHYLPPPETHAVYRQLYNGESIQDFLGLCPPNPPEPIPKDATEEEAKQYKKLLLAYRHCEDWTNAEKEALQEAKDRMIEFQNTVQQYYDLSVQLFFFTYILVLGILLIILGHFSTRSYYDSHYLDRTKGFHFFVYNFGKWHAWETRTKIVPSARAEEEDTSSGEEYEAYDTGRTPKVPQRKKYNRYPRRGIRRRKMILFSHGLERL